MTNRNLLMGLLIAAALSACTTTGSNDSDLSDQSQSEMDAEVEGLDSEDGGSKGDVAANDDVDASDDADAGDGEDAVIDEEAEDMAIADEANDPVEEDDLDKELVDEELADEGASKTAKATPTPEPTPEKVAAAEAEPEPVSEPETSLEPEPSVQKTEPPIAQEEPANSSNQFSEVDVTDLRYLSNKGGGTVLIETSAPATFRTREVPNKNQVVVEIANARLPERLKRPYVTKDFRQEIASINAYQSPGSSTARFVIQMNKGEKVNVQQDGRTLMVAANGGAISMASAEFDDDTLAKEDTRRRSYDLAQNNNGGTSDTRSLPESSVDSLNGTEVRFFGKRINIEVSDMNIRDAINFIAEQSGSNLVVSDEVTGNISLKLREVPWDQALLIIMKAKQLGYVRQGNILRIAPLATLEKEAENARKVLEAQRLAQPLKVKVIPVSYAKVEDLEKQVQSFLTPNRGKIVADARTSSLIVTDIPEIIERVNNLIKALDTPPLQVLIEGKVVEAGEKFGQELGVNWSLRGEDISIPGGKNAVLTPDLNVGPLDTKSTGSGLSLNLAAGTLDVLGDLSAALGLFEREEQVKVVSSPRIVAMNNTKATINQVTNIAIVTTTPATANSPAITNVKYEPVSLSLDVTPQITADSDVILQVQVKRQFAGAAQSNGQRDINSREANTQVLVRNGQTAVIGGIYQSDATNGERGVPWLRKIPLLGWLFKSRSITEEKNELLIFLTPRILNAKKSAEVEEATL